MVTIKLTELNNKSRKGLYVYVKNKNKPARYYKYKEDTPLDIYKNFYESKYIEKEIPTKTKYSRKKGKTKTLQYIKKIKKQPIKKYLQKGIGQANINNILKLNNQQTKKIYTQILKNIVIDKQVRNIIATNENMNKLKTRIEYQIKIENAKGETLLATKTFNKLPQQVKEELNKKYPKGSIVETEEYDRTNRLEPLGYINPTVYKRGFVEKIKVKILFRKG